MQDALDVLLTEGINPSTAQIDALDTLSLVQAINDQDALVAQAVRAELPAIAQAVDGIVACLKRGGHLVYVGAGTSGRLGVLDASECPPTFGVSPGLVRGIIAGGDRALRASVERAEDDPDAGADAVVQENVGGADVVVGIAASGRTPFVLGAVREARKRGALTVGIACNRPSELEAQVDVMIAPLVGSEVISGSTRMKAGTAQKMVLNMLSTATMIRLGKTYGNLMVDLKATNAKLRVRARRLVVQACGIDADLAEAVLSRCDYEVKTAIVMVKVGLDAAAARARLDACDGFIRRVFEQV
ncbi:MAG: N-acetylmuramic acid 6-phosphate etherase [Anaerolineae bacterium]|nr:N-acetylmuramic acid 6-phosphate etherase [Anaerolineae bacterium]